MMTTAAKDGACGVELCFHQKLGMDDTNVFKLYDDPRLLIVKTKMGKQRHLDSGTRDTGRPNVVAKISSKSKSRKRQRLPLDRLGRLQC